MKLKVVFISESIRRDSQAPLRFFKDIEPIHFYLTAPYGDMNQKDLLGSKQVNIDHILDEIIKTKPDVIQGVEPFGSRLALRLAIISKKAARRTGAKLIIPVLENRPINERFNLPQRVVLRFFCPGYFKLADAVIALNKGAVTNIKHYYPKAKIVQGIVWGVWGVDTELFKPLGKKVPGLMIYAGRWIEDKGIKYMLEAINLAKDKYPQVKLQLFGQGQYEQEMRRYVAAHQLEENVEFVGQLKNAQLPEYFSRAELSIYPSITQKRWEEQVGTVNFQAMACETPALTTNSGAIGEYLKNGQGAILVKERSSEALAQAIIGYFLSKNKVKMQKEAREFMMRYDIRGEIAKAEKLIKGIVNNT